MADRLTAKEFEVLRRRALGQTTTAITHAMRISKNTLHAHLQNAYRKLEATCAEDAYRELGWLEVPAGPIDDVGQLS